MLLLTISMFFVYLLIIAYILYREIHAIKGLGEIFNKKRVYWGYGCSIVLVASTLILGGILPKGTLAVALHKFSNYWLGFLIIHFFFLVVADIIVSIMKLINRKHRIEFLYNKHGFRVATFIVLALSFIFTFIGFGHARDLKENTYDVSVNKSAGDIKELKIALIADLHLGYSVGCDYLQEVVDRINEGNPDLVVIAGDIYDNDYDALDDPERLSEIFKSIKSKYGVFATYGNHDVDATLVGGFTLTANADAYRDERLENLLKSSNIVTLEDENVLIEDSFYVLGRIDLELTGDGTSEHAEIDALTKQLDKTKPILCITHEPDELDETADAGVDVLMCGHTHAGQFFPLTIVQPLRWRNYWGYLQVEQMHNIVTSGIGVYGPNMRLFTDSEVAWINVSFN